MIAYPILPSTNIFLENNFKFSLEFYSENQLKDLIRYLSVKYLISEQKIYDNINDIENYVRKKELKFREVLKISQADLKEITDNYVLTNRILKSRIDSDIELSIDNLIKIVKKANILLLNKSTNEAVTIDVDKYKVGALRHINGSLTIFTFHPTNIKGDASYLGEGGFGKVQKIINFSLGCFQALKIAMTLDCNQDICNEIVLINSIARQETSVGIQETVIGVKFEENIQGYITKIYNKNSLNKAVLKGELDLLSRKKIILLAIQLFEGLRVLHKQQIIHGDIKSRNCLLNEIEVNGIPQLEVVLSDLGGSLNIESQKEKIANLTSLSIRDIIGVFTPGYITEADMSYTISSRENSYQDWGFLLKKRDVFALASTIWFVVTKQRPFPMQSSFNFPNTNFLLNSPLVKKKLGEEVHDILVKALEENPWDRSSKSEILEVFKKELVKEEKSTTSFMLSDSSTDRSFQDSEFTETTPSCIKC